MMRDEDWLDRRYYGGDLPEAAERALHAAGLDWADEAAAEAHIARALAAAPDHLAVRIGAYKFFFYRHRLAEALPHAEACLAEAMRRLHLTGAWSEVDPTAADFEDVDPDARLFLFSLLAWGYLLIRLDRTDEGGQALAKVCELDPDDRLGARALLTAFDQRRNGDEEE
jgi:hypothetical protein